MLIHIKAVCLPAGVGALGDITTQLQFDDVHSRKKTFIQSFFCFFFLKSHVDERMMMSQYVIRQVYTHNLNNDKVGEGWGYS